MVGYRLVLVLSLLLTSSACGKEKTGSSQPRVIPSGTVVARVADEVITSQTVASIAHEQNVDVNKALERAIFDALLAEAARDDVFARHHAESTVLARATLRDLWQRETAPPISEQELDEATRVFWIQVARPAGVHAVHAVVHATSRDSAAHHQRARQMAEQLRAVADAAVAVAQKQPPQTADERAMFRTAERPQDPAVDPFIKAVKAVPRDGLRVTAEDLPAVATDGRVINAGSRSVFRGPFVAAAFALARRGDLSGVVQTDDGYHVIMLLEKTPEKFLSRDERLDVLGDKIQRRRGSMARKKLLDQLRGATPPELTGNVDALLKLVPVDDSGAAGQP